jgi:hypothetical protein
MTSDLLGLIARARQRDPEAAAALADLVAGAVATPDQRVSAAFRLKRRGGDPRAEQRRRRDEAICALARLSGNGRPIEQQARDIAQRLDRYRPMPVETTPERRLMKEIEDLGLPPIGQRRISKILREEIGALVAQTSRQD